MLKPSIFILRAQWAKTEAKDDMMYLFLKIYHFWNRRMGWKAGMGSKLSQSPQCSRAGRDGSGGATTGWRKVGRGREKRDIFGRQSDWHGEEGEGAGGRLQVCGLRYYVPHRNPEGGESRFAGEMVERGGVRDLFQTGWPETCEASKRRERKIR